MIVLEDLMRYLIGSVAFSLWLGIPVSACPPGLSMADIAAPTNPAVTAIRGVVGEFDAPRGGKPDGHTGVDIRMTMTAHDQEDYAVRAMADGIVAYAAFNGKANPDDDGPLNDGYGNTIIIDHGNDCYTMYAHLAQEPFTPRRSGEGLRGAAR